MIIFRKLYEMPKILKYLGNFEHFVPFHLPIYPILSKVMHAVIHFEDGVFSIKHDLARAIIVNMISRDYVSCYIPRSLNYNFQSMRLIMTLGRVYTIKQF